MNLASVRGPLLHLVLVQVCGLLAGHSQGPYLGGVVDQLVWPTLLQGYVVNLAPTHPPGQVTHCAALALPKKTQVRLLSSPSTHRPILIPISVLVPVHHHGPQSLHQVHHHLHCGGNETGLDIVG